MKSFRAKGRVILVGVGVGVVFAQSPDTTPKFGMADVHPSPHARNAYMRGPFIRAGRYEIRSATMLDLIQNAWSIAPDKVIGGPSWLETDRFDISAKLPPDSTPENLPLALRSLLAERFKLVVHDDTRPLPAYALTVGKKPQLKETEGSGEPGCRNATAPGGRGGGGGDRATAPGGFHLPRGNHGRFCEGNEFGPGNAFPAARWKPCDRSDGS